MRKKIGGYVVGGKEGTDKPAVCKRKNRGGEVRD